MQKIFIFIIFTVFLISCKEDPVEPTVDLPEISAVLSLTETPKKEIKNGESATFRWILVTAQDLKEYTYSFNNSSSITSSNNKTFTNLSPGDYTFSVKAITTSGKESNTESYSFKVVENSSASGDIIYQDNAVKLSDSELLSISGFTDNSITFSNPSTAIQNLKIGDVIFGRHSFYSNYVVSRKIIGLQKRANSKSDISFITEKIQALSDIIKTGKISIPNISLFDYSKPNLELIIYDIDENESTTSDQTRLYLDFFLNAGLDGSMNFSSSSTTATLTLKSAGSIDAFLISSAGIAFNKKVTLFNTPPIVLVIPGVEASLDVNIYAELSSQFQGTFSTAARGELNFSSTIEYSNSWSKLNNLEINLSADEPTLNLQGDAKLIVGARLNLIFYEILGPSIGIKPYISIDYNSDRIPKGEIYSGIDGEVGFTTRWLSSIIPTKYWTITGPIYHIYSWGTTNNQAPVLQSTVPSNGSTNFGLTNTLYWEFSDNESDPLTYDLYLSKINPPTLIAQNISGLPAYNHETFEANTTYYWRVEAFDGQSSTLTDVLSFTTESEQSSTFFNLSPADGAVNVALDGNISWDFLSPSGETSNNYSIFLGTNQYPQPEDHLGWISENKIQYSSLNPNTKYYWKVYTSVAGTNYSSDIYSFTTGSGVGTEKSLIIRPGSEGEDVTISISSHNQGDPVYSENPNEEDHFIQWFIGDIGGTDVEVKKEYFLKFPLDEILNKELISVEFMLHSYAWLEHREFGLYKVNEDWSESTINWLNKPSCSLISEKTFPLSPPEWIKWDVTELVKNWIVNEANNGFSIKPQFIESSCTFWGFDHYYNSEPQSGVILVVKYIE